MTQPLQGVGKELQDGWPRMHMRAQTHLCVFQNCRQQLAKLCLCEGQKCLCAFCRGDVPNPLLHVGWGFGALGLDLDSFAGLWMLFATPAEHLCKNKTNHYKTIRQLISIACAQIMIVHLSWPHTVPVFSVVSQWMISAVWNSACAVSTSLFRTKHGW